MNPKSKNPRYIKKGLVSRSKIESFNIVTTKERVKGV